MKSLELWTQIRNHGYLQLIINAKTSMGMKVIGLHCGTTPCKVDLV